MPNCPVVFTWSPGVNKHKNSTGREVFLNRLSALDHHVDRTICTHDIMHFGNDEAYFSIGRSIVEQVASCLITEKHYNPSRIFDFGCAYGRATRFLKALFPDAAFTVADPLALAVEFCADQFGAKGYHCSPDNPVTDAAGPFDIILLYSVINHLDETLSEAILDGLSRKLGEDGLLIFAVGNPGFSHSRYRQNEGQKYSSEGLADMAADALTRGFGFVDQSGKGAYGQSVTTRFWIESFLRKRPRLRHVSSTSMIGQTCLDLHVIGIGAGNS